jgi:hypothetical protein
MGHETIWSSQIRKQRVMSSPEPPLLHVHALRLALPHQLIPRRRGRDQLTHRIDRCHLRGEVEALQAEGL